MRRALLAALCVLGSAGSALAQAWTPATITPGGDTAAYRFTDTTDSGVLELEKSCRAIVYGFDPDIAGTQTTATANLLACPNKTATGTACQTIAALSGDTPGTVSNPVYRNLRCDVQDAPSATTAACYVACAAQTSGGGSGGGPGAGDATELTYEPGEPAATQWDAVCEGVLVFTDDYLDCTAGILANLVAISTGAAPPAGTCDSPNGQPCMDFEIESGDLEGVYAAPDGGDFVKIGPAVYSGVGLPGGVEECHGVNDLYVATGGDPANPDDGPIVCRCEAVGDPGTWTCPVTNAASIEMTGTWTKLNPTTSLGGSTPTVALQEWGEGVQDAIETNNATLFAANTAAITVANVELSCIPWWVGGAQAAPYTGAGRTGHTAAQATRCGPRVTKPAYFDRLECQVSTVTGWASGDLVTVQVVLEDDEDLAGTPDPNVLGSANLDFTTWVAGGAFSIALDDLSASVATAPFQVYIMLAAATDAGANNEYDVSCLLYWTTIEE